MSDADDHLRALFAQDDPPARDAAFSTAVMEEIARRQFLADLGVLAAATSAGAAVLWAAWPGLTPMLAHLGQGLAPLAAGLALAATAVAVVDRRLGPAAVLES